MIPRNDKSAAVFLDRDGTLNEEVGYLRRIEDLRLLPGAPEAVRLLNEAGFKVVVVTNQSGVARGLFTEAFVAEVHRTMSEILGRRGARIDRFYYCPHHPEGMGPYRRTCRCRKPEPGMLFRAAVDLALDLGRSYLVGDMPKDLEAARRAAVKGILVRTGYGRESASGPAGEGPEAVHVADDLPEAARWIIADRDHCTPGGGDRGRR